jgi:hypothetical protein
MGFVKLFAIGFCRGSPLYLLPHNLFGEIDFLLLHQGFFAHHPNTSCGSMHAPTSSQSALRIINSLSSILLI